MAGGTSIRLFLPDGDPDGVRIVWKSHWTGVAVAAPRSRYAEARTSRDEFRRPGVYVLVGPADAAAKEGRIYIGEGEDPRARIDIHHANKDFWNRVIVFSSGGGQPLNKAAIRYIEARLLQLAAAAARFELDNGNAPALPPLSEPDVEDAEAFIAEMLVIYPILGVGAFEPVEQVAPQGKLYLEGPDAKGEGVETEDGFIVYGGAHARAQTVHSMPGWAAGLRAGLVDAGGLIPDGDGASLRLVDNHKFKSPSAAAAVLLGRSAAGPLEWKDQSGKPLRQIREEAVGEATAPAD